MRDIILINYVIVFYTLIYSRVGFTFFFNFGGRGAESDRFYLLYKLKSHTLIN